MPNSSVLLVPIGIGPSDLTATESVLAGQHAEYLIPRRVEDAFRAVVVESPDVAIIHGGRMQPVVVDVVRRLHSLKVPTLVLLRLLTDHQEAVLLGAGALDVVGLPTSYQRLQARLLAMQRYVNGAQGTDRDEQHVIGDLTIDVGRREVSVGGEPLRVTRTEFDLLLAMARRPGTVLTREELTLQAMSRSSTGTHALESHLSRLRGKILSAQGPRLFESVRGVGYRLGG